MKKIEIIECPQPSGEVFVSRFSNKKLQKALQQLEETKLDHIEIEITSDKGGDIQTAHITIDRKDIGVQFVPRSLVV